LQSCLLKKWGQEAHVSPAYVKLSKLCLKKQRANKIVEVVLQVVENLLYIHEALGGILSKERKLN
jgi:hypothetical protein